MATTGPHRGQGEGIWGRIAGLLVILLLVPVAPPLAGAPPPGDSFVQRRAPHLQVTVHHGRLSVNLWEADLGEVLAQIQRQAGISIRVHPSPERTVSAQFTDVVLDQGLRRLLRLASQSYAMRYAPGLTGEVALQEVRGFAEAPAGDRSPTGAAETGEQPATEAGKRFIDTVLQRQAAAPAVAPEEEGEAASRFRDALERQAAAVPGEPDAPESDAASRFLDAFEHSSAPAPGEPDAPESDAARRFRDALEGFTAATPR